MKKLICVSKFCNTQIGCIVNAKGYCFERYCPVADKAVKLAEFNGTVTEGKKCDGEPVDEPFIDWCAIGKWVYCTKTKEYGKITEKRITNHYDQFMVSMINGDMSFISRDPIYEQCWEKARITPWTFGNVPTNRIKVKAANSRGYFDVIAVDFDDGFGENENAMALMWSCRRQEMFVSSRYVTDFIQLDGSPCGIPEHLENGEWVR